MWDDHLGRISVAEHHIKFLDDNVQPVHLALYRAEPNTREFAKIESEEMLKDNIIEPAQMEWVAPIVFAPKLDGSLRFLDHYLCINAAKKRDSYTIMKDYVSRL